MIVFLLVVAAATPAPSRSADPRMAITWSAPVEIASGGGHRGAWRQNESDYDYVDDPTVALDLEGNAVVAWVDQKQKDVLFQIYNREGKPRFKEPVNVSRSPKIFSWLPRLAVPRANSNDVFVLWQEIVFSGGTHGGEIFFARSRDGGANFRPPINLSNSINGDGKGRINKETWHNGSLDLAIGSNHTLYAAWTEYDGALWFSRSTDRGESFTKPSRINSGGKAKPARAPALAIGHDNNLYIAWTVGEEEGADVRIVKSSDDGRTFGEATIVAQTKGYSDAPKIALDRKGTVHAVFGESSGGPFDRYEVRYTRSSDGARTFEQAREISVPHLDGIESSAFPFLSMDAHDHLYVLWELYPDWRKNPRGLGFVCSRDGGNTFSAPAPIPASVDPAGGLNGSHQGLLMRKLAVNGAGEVAVVNSSLKHGEKSRVWLMRGHVPTR